MMIGILNIFLSRTHRFFNNIYGNPIIHYRKVISMRLFQACFIICILLLTGCTAQNPNMATPAPIVPPLSAPPPTPNPNIPDFDHIVVIIFENMEFESVIGSPEAPNMNRLANENTLLTEYYAITHPSLPNYIALIGGDTYGYTENCKNCPVTATNLADLIERSGRTWKTYQESMLWHCSMSDPFKKYVLRHNPFLFFSSILNDKKRCAEHVVDWDDLEEDASDGNLPNFIFITPNICSSGHDCSLEASDTWLGELMPSLIPPLQKESDDYLVVITWDEGTTNKSCCGLPQEAGGKIATILVSPKARSGFQDSTPYTAYSLLRTISESWGLPLLGHAADESNVPILAPWKQ
jgi:hypothetical protein